MAIVNVVLGTCTGDPKMVSGMGRMNNDPVFRVVATGAVFAAYVLLLAPLAGPIDRGALFLAPPPGSWPDR
jgi:hypothetical protein